MTRQSALPESDRRDDSPVRRGLAALLLRGGRLTKLFKKVASCAPAFGGLALLALTASFDPDVAEARANCRQTSSNNDRAYYDCEGSNRFTTDVVYAKDRKRLRVPQNGWHQTHMTVQHKRAKFGGIYTKYTFWSSDFPSFEAFGRKGIWMRDNESQGFVRFRTWGHPNAGHGGSGIKAENTGGDTVHVQWDKNNIVIGRTNGLFLQNEGKMIVEAHNSKFYGRFWNGIEVSSKFNTLKVDVQKVYGVQRGIQVANANDGYIRVRDSVQGKKSHGIFIFNHSDASTSLTIIANKVNTAERSAAAIYAKNTGAGRGANWGGPTYISGGRIADGNNGKAIVAKGKGSLTVNFTGDIDSKNTGIDFVTVEQNTDAYLNLNASRVSVRDSIKARAINLESKQRDVKLVSPARTLIETADTAIHAVAKRNIHIDVKGTVRGGKFGVYAKSVSGGTVNVTVGTVKGAASNAAVEIKNEGTGTTTFKATGKITAENGDGLNLPGHAGNPTMRVDVAEVEAGNWGLRLVHKGSGNVTVNATGAVTSTGTTSNRRAVSLVNEDANANSEVRLNLNAVENRAGGQALRVEQKAKGDVTISAASVTRKGTGAGHAVEIVRPNTSTGSNIITVTGSADAAEGNSGGDGISVIDPSGVSDANGRLSISVGGARGGWTGIRLVHRRGGAVTINATGAVSSVNRTGSDAAFNLENQHTGTASINLSFAAVTTSARTGAAIKLDQRGSGNITVRATGAVTRTGNGNEAAVLIKRASGSRGNVRLTFTGEIDAANGGGGGDGINLVDPSGTSDSTGTLFISTAKAQGGWVGIRVAHRRGGDVTINATGAVVSTQSHGSSRDPALDVTNFATSNAVNISVATVTASAGRGSAIKVVNQSSGNLNLSASGPVTRRGSGNAHAVVIDRGTATSGNISLSFTGEINANAGGGGGDAINLESNAVGAQGNVLLSVATATGGWAGVRIRHKRGGDVTINVTGNVTSKGGSDKAISLINDDHDSTLKINVGTTTSVGPTVHAQGSGDADGIYVDQQHNGDVIIEAHAQTAVKPKIKSSGRHGIYVKNSGSGKVTIVGSKLEQVGNNYINRDSVIEGGSRGAAVKVNALSSSGPVKIDVGTVNSSGYGLDVVKQGADYTRITANRSASITASRDGIRIDRQAHSNANASLRITAGTVSGGRAGIRAVHRGAGTLSINVGNVISTNSDSSSSDNAMLVDNHGGNANITVGRAASSGGRGHTIKFTQHTAGAVTLNVTGTVARTGAGAGNAVWVNHNNSGNVTLTVSGQITSTDGGVYLKNDSADSSLKLSVATVTAAGSHTSGGADAIRVIQEHNANVEVSASGPVTTSGRHGVFVTQQGSGDVSISLAGNVSGGSDNGDSAIRVETGAGKNVEIGISGGAVGGVDENAIIETAGSATVDVTSQAEIKGDVDLGAGDDELRLVQASAPQAGDWAGGAGQDALTFDRSTGALNSATGWETITIGNGSNIHMTGTVSTDTLTVDGTLTVGTGSNDFDTDASLTVISDLAGDGNVAINADFTDPRGIGYDTLEIQGNVTEGASLAVTGETQLDAGKFHFDRPLRFSRVFRVTGRGALTASSIELGAVGYRAEANPTDAQSGWFDLVRYYTNWCKPVAGTPGAFLCSGSTLIGGPQSLSASGDVTMVATLASETGVHVSGAAFTLEQTDGSGGISMTQSAFGSSISGTVDGVVASIDDGAVSISLTGLADGQSGYGIKVTGTPSDAGISVTAADVSGVAAGIMVVSSGGAGGIRVKTTGAVSATGTAQSHEAAVVVKGTDETGAVTLDVATVTGSLTGILASQKSANALSITARGTVTGKRGNDRAGRAGIDAVTHSGGDLTISAAGVTALGNGTIGIKAVSRGAGDVSIAATGLVSSEQGVGIDAEIRGSGNLSIAAASVTGSLIAIKAVGSGAGGETGTIAIAATGHVQSTTSTGVSASANAGGDISVNVATVTANASGADGIKAYQKNEQSASGGISIAATGSVTADNYGINAEVKAGAAAVRVAAATVTGGNVGIRVAASTGDVTVMATGAVSGTAAQARGIDVNASGGDVTVSVASVSVTGSGEAIKVEASGAGVVSISASGAVAGGASGHGIYVDHSGSGDTRIALSGSVTGGQNQSAVKTDDGDGVSVSINLLNGASVGTGTRSAIMGSRGNTEVTVHTGGEIFGSVTLNAGDDKLTFAGGAFGSVTDMDGGEGTDTLTFSDDASGALHANVMSAGLKGWENVFITDGASISNVKLANDSDNLTFDGADISSIGTLTADGANNDNTLSFKNLSGTLADATMSGWDEISIGEGATIKFGVGSHTFEEDLTLAANGTLDIGADTDTSDILTISGDFSGGGTVAINANVLPDAGASDKLKITGNVTGITVVRLHAIAGSLLSNQTDEDRPQTIEGVIEVTGTVSPGAFFATGDIVFGNVGYVLEVDDNNERMFNLERKYTNQCSAVGGADSGVYTCSGSGPIGDSQDLQARGKDLTVTLNAETPTVALDSGETAFNLTQRAEGGITFTQSANGRWIRGAEKGIDAKNNGDGAISIDVNAALSGAGDDGIYAKNESGAGGAITISTGPVSGFASGIDVVQLGAAAVNVSASGTVTGTSQDGIYALANGAGGPISVTAAAVTGGKFGIRAISSGTLAGAISVKATGAVTGTGTQAGVAGIHVAGSARTTDVTIDALAVSGGSGIDATNSGTGKLDIKAGGAVSGTGTDGVGIRGRLTSASGGDLTVTAANSVSGSAFGIEVRSSGSGAVDVAASGAVTASQGKGIFVHAESTAGTLTIAAATVTGSTAGIEAIGGKAVSLSASGAVRSNGASATGISAQSSGGAVSVTAAVVNGGGYGIVAKSSGAGVTVKATGTVTGAANKGIVATTSSGASGAVAVAAMSVSGGQGGIEAMQLGAGSLTVNAGDSVFGNAGTGIDALAGSSAGALAVSADGAVSGSGHGVKAVSSGTGSVSVQVGGAVTASAGEGIFGSVGAQGEALTITAAAATGSTIGIRAIGSGAGAISIKATGAVTGTSTAGVQAVGGTAAGAMKIDVAAATGKVGIDARQASSNRLDIEVSGSVSGTGAANEGIFALASSNATISIDAATVTGAGYGIRTLSSGTGAVAIMATGTVTGSSKRGIDAQASSGAVTITAAAVSGATMGVYAKTSGGISIATSGSVSGNSHSGIYANQTGAGTTRITVFGGVSTSSSDSNRAAIKTAVSGSDNVFRPVAITLERGASVSAENAIRDASFGNATVTVKAGATISGKIDLGSGSDVLHFAGGDFSNVREMQGGAGTDTLRISGGSGAFHSDVRNQGLKGFENVIIESGATISNRIRLNASSDNLTFNGADISNIGTMSADGGGEQDTLSLNGVTASLANKTMSGWDKISIGAGSTITLGTGSHNRSYDLSLAAGATLNIGNDADTSDALLLTGNFEGGGTITINANFTGSGSSDQVFFLGSDNAVTGVTSILVTPVGQLAGNETDFDRPQRIEDVITVAGTLSAGAFTSVAVGFQQVGYRLEVSPDDSKVFDLVQFSTSQCTRGEGGSGVFVCDGPQIASTQTLAASGRTRLSVTLTSRTAVNAGAFGFVLDQSGGRGGITFTQSATGKAITAGQTAIDATNSGGGTILIDVNGTVTGVRGDGIRVESDSAGSGITITAASVAGGNAGIAVVSSGAGAASVKASGTIQGGTGAGVQASVGGALSLDVATVTGKSGIDVSSSGGNVTISAAAVTGTEGGIKVSASGTNNVSIMPTGAVAGGSGDGIYVDHDGNGRTTITVSNAVTGGDGAGVAAIRTARTAGNLNINLNSGASVGFGARNAIVDGAGNSAVTVNTGASIAGKVRLGGGNDRLEFRGGGFSSVTEMDGGAGARDMLVFSDVSGTLNPAVVAAGLKGWENVTVKSGASITGSIKLAESSDNLTFDRASIAGIGALTASQIDNGAVGNNTNNTLTFKNNVSGSLNGASITGWEEIRIESGSRINFGNGAHTLSAATLNVGAGASVAVDDGAEANDTLTLSGNLAGAGTFILAANFRQSSRASDKLVITGNVSGAHTVSFRSIQGPLNPNDTDDLLPIGDVITVQGTIAPGASFSGVALFGAFAYRLTPSDDNPNVFILESDTTNECTLINQQEGWVCAGAYKIGAPEVMGGSGASNVSVVVNSETPVDANGTAFMLTHSQAGGIVFTQSATGKTISGEESGIVASNAGGGEIKIEVTGTVVGADGDGISATNDASSAKITITAASVHGSETGIRADEGGSGAVKIVATGTVTGVSEEGIYAKTGDSGRAITVTAAAAVGGRAGIKVSAGGRGAVSVKSTGTATGTSTAGIQATGGARTTNVKIDAAAAGGKSGIDARHEGTGDLEVQASGAVTGTGTGGMGIYGLISNARGDALTITATSAVSGSAAGIKAVGRGSGAVKVSATGGVTGTGTGGVGVDAAAAASAGALTVNVATVTGSAVGIRAVGSSRNDVNISAGGLVAATGVSTAVGIDALTSSAGDLTVTAAAVTGSAIGIKAVSSGAGAIRVKATGAVAGAGTAGVYASGGTTTTGLTVEVATVTGSAGIDARHAGAGTLRISASGMVTASAGTGIEGRASGAATLSITAAAVTGIAIGIKARSSGAGAVSVRATGAVTGTGAGGVGIDASAAGGSIAVSAATVTGSTTGIDAAATGGGSVSISASGAVTGTGAGGVGIDASAAGGNVVVSAATVTGTATGIKVAATGGGRVSISATGAVTGTGRDGIYVDHNGSGATAITVAAAVTGAAGSGFAAIRTDASSGRTVTISLNSGASVGTSGRNAIMGKAGNTAVTANSGATVTGSVDLGSGADTMTVNAGATVSGSIDMGGGNDNLTFAGGAFSNVSEMDGGVGADTLTFRSGSGQLHSTVRTQGLKGWESVVVGGNATLSGDIKLAADSRNLTLDGADFAAINKLDGGSGSSNTLEFKNLTGEIGSTVLENWETISIGTESSISFGASVTTRTLSLSGGGTLDARRTSDTVNETTTVSGSLAGGGAITLDVDFSDEHAADMVVIDGNAIQGTTTIRLNRISDDRDYGVLERADENSDVITVIEVRGTASKGAFVLESLGDEDSPNYTGEIWTYRLERRTAGTSTRFVLKQVSANRCKPVGDTGVFTCSGQNQINTVQSLSANGDTDLSVTLEPQILINANATAVVLTQSGGRGGIEFTQSAGGSEIKGDIGAIRASNSGGGAISIDVNGSVTGSDDFGIYASEDASGAGITITAGQVMGGKTGIKAFGGGSGAVSVKASGTVTGTSEQGVYARATATGSLCVDVAAVTGGTAGIKAVGSGSGDVCVKASGTVMATGANGIGIDASASGGNVTVSAATVTGATGIKVAARGAGNVSVSATGAVTGTTGDGIFVDHDGSGATTITVTTAVTGGASASVAAIRTDVSAGGATILLNSGASVDGRGFNAIKGGAGGTTVTVNTGARILGKISLGGGDDRLTFVGGTFTTVTEFDGGAGTDTLTFSAGAGSLHQTVRSEGLKGWEEVVVGSGAALSGEIKLHSSSRKLTLHRLAGITALTGGGSNTSLELRGVSGALQGVTNWGTVTADSGSSISLGDGGALSAGNLIVNGTLTQSGSGTVSGNLDVAAGGTLSVGAGSNGSGDSLTVTGNLSGGGTVTLDVDFVSGLSDRLVVDGTVSGTRTVSLRKLGAVNIDTAVQRIGGVITVKGRASKDAFRVGGDFNFGAIAYRFDMNERSGSSVFDLERYFANDCERVEGVPGAFSCSGPYRIGEPQPLASTGSSALTVSLASRTPVKVDNGSALLLRQTGRAGIAFQQQPGGNQITAAGDSINAVNTGGGSVAIVATGPITAGNDGVSASNDTSGLGVRVAVATVSAGNDGVNVSNGGAGGVEVSATGSITAGNDGVSARVGAGGLGAYVAVKTVTAKAGDGVSVDSDGAGSVSVMAESAKGGDDGIRVRTGSRGTNLVISAGSTEGENNGISVNHQGRGLARITASGPVSGGTRGIYAQVGRNGGLSIYASGAVTGTRQDGIRVRSAAKAPISISVSSEVTGGRFSSAAAIKTDSDGAATTIMLESGASVGATGRGAAIIDGGGNATVTVQAGAALSGDVRLGDGTDELILAGGDFSGITGIDGGSGEDTLRINAGSGRLGALSDGSGVKNVESIFVSGSAKLEGDFRVGPQTRELVFVNYEEEFKGDSKLVGNGNARLAFQGVQGKLDLSRLSNWGTLVIDGITMMTLEGSTLEKDAAGGLVVNGTMRFGDDSKTDDIFTVEGDISGSGQVVVGADLSIGKSDKLVIEGDASGSIGITMTGVSSEGAPDAGDGVEIVTVAGKADASSFKLVGDPIPIGAFTYDLEYVSDGGKFVLRPGQTVSDTGAALRTGPAAIASGFATATTLAARTAARAPAAAIGAGIGSAATYNERGGDLAGQGAADLAGTQGRSVWMRFYNDSREYGADAVSGETQIDSTGLQFGMDLLSMESAIGRWVAGLTAQYGTAKVEANARGGVGTQDASGYALGGTFSWLGYSGFYADVQAQFGTVDSSYASSSMGTIKDGVSAGTSLTSLEVGWRVAAGETTTVVPQAQISVGSVKSDGFTAESLVVASTTATSVDGRLGLAAEFSIPGGAVRVSSSLSRTLSEPDGTVVNGKTVSQELPNGWMEFGIGASQDLSDDAVLFLDGIWRTGVGGADSTGTSISGGIKLSW